MCVCCVQMEIYLPPPQHLYICVPCGICARAMLLSNCQRQEYGKRKFIYMCVSGMCVEGVLAVRRSPAQQPGNKTGVYE